MAVVGDGSIRKCRDFNRLETWAKKHTACFRKSDPGETERPFEQKLQWCPLETGYLPRIREYFDYDSDWVPPARKGIREPLGEI